MFMASKLTIDDLRSQLLTIKDIESPEPPDPLRSGDVAEVFREDRKSALARVERIIAAMTEDERRDPDVIGPAERQRIAAASNARPEEVEHFLAAFAKMQTLLRETAGMTFWDRIKRTFTG